MSFDKLGFATLCIIYRFLAHFCTDIVPSYRFLIILET